VLLLFNSKQPKSSLKGSKTLVLQQLVLVFVLFAAAACSPAGL
jgi:hypothetical protein